MMGDTYQVFYTEGDGTHMYGPQVNSWEKAKTLRGEAFYRSRKVVAAWVMRTNPSLDLRTDKFGFTLRRNRHERQ